MNSKLLLLIISLFLFFSLLFSLSSCKINGGEQNISGNTDNVGSFEDCVEGNHTDVDNDYFCDICASDLAVIIDFYVLNDLHGKFCDTDTQPGVDEIGTYFKKMSELDDNMVILSSGDMWQGTAESNLTDGVLITEWMNELNFTAMTLGNHEFDWGEEAIRKNAEVAEFPFLAINIYSNETGKLVDYCTPSIMIEREGIKIGIIGAIGDCYSSISSDMVEGVHFKVGRELTNLVKAESDRLRAEGADLIVYSLHDGYGRSSSGTSMIGASAISSYYDTSLSSKYVDLVFEAHSHQSYTLVDGAGIYHCQGGGENSGISHIEIKVNSSNGKNKVTQSGFVGNGAYRNLDDHAETEAVEDKYSDIIDFAYSELGIVSREYMDYEVEDYVASLYLEVGEEKWGSEYDIVLGGGFLKTRSPYDLAPGSTTYADILSLLPFDNRIVLCSVSGYNLKNKFIYSTNTDYHIAYSSYGNGIKNSISDDETYYIIVDTYTAYYAPNHLTVIDFYDESTYARDLFAEKVKEGVFEIKHDDYTLTSVVDAIKMGEHLSDNTATTKSIYIKGTVKSAPEGLYGNLYLIDENGDEIYVYGIYDLSGTRYDAMNNKPMAGDTIVVYAPVYKFVYNGKITIELKNAVVIEINP